MAKNTEKTTQPESAEVTPEAEKQSEVLDLRAVYADLIRQMKSVEELMRAQGIIEPPKETTSFGREVETTDGKKKWIPMRPDGTRPGAPLPGNSDADVPWTKGDLDPEDVYSFVPMPVPGLVHPLLDEDGRPKIFLTVNGLTACLTVGVLNEKIPGMWYWAYKNAEDLWRLSDDYRQHGPKSAPWVGQGPGGKSTWYWEREAPSAWIDLDGRYYTAGAPMPGSVSAE
jgi:hypothetical protein